MQRNKFGVYNFDHANMFTMLLQNFLPKIGLQISYLLKILIMHLICINHNNIIKRILPKKGRSNTLYIVSWHPCKILRRSAPLGPRSEGGIKLTPPPPPPPVKNLLSKSPVKIGRLMKFGQLLHNTCNILLRARYCLLQCHIKKGPQTD